MVNSADRRQELHKIAKQCSKILKDRYKVKKIFLIGSLVKGIVHKRSDIDLVVEGLPQGLYMKVLTDLWDFLPPGVELNLIPFEDAFDTFKEKTLNEGELLYG